MSAGRMPHAVAAVEPRTHDGIDFVMVERDVFMRVIVNHQPVYATLETVAGLRKLAAEILNTADIAEVLLNG